MVRRPLFVEISHFSALFRLLILSADAVLDISGCSLATLPDLRLIWWSKRSTLAETLLILLLLSLVRSLSSPLSIDSRDLLLLCVYCVLQFSAVALVLMDAHFLHITRSTQSLRFLA